MADIKTVETNCWFCGEDHRPSVPCEDAKTTKVMYCECGHPQGDHRIGGMACTKVDMTPDWKDRVCQCDKFVNDVNVKAIAFIDYPVIVCYLCTFEPRYGAGDGRDICGCSGLVTLLERADILGKLTW